MAERVRIKTPWKQQWLRLRHQLVPVLIFVTTGALATYLWGRHSGIPAVTGEVQLVQSTVASPVPGVLVRLPEHKLDPFDYVQEGQLIARLDDQPLRADLAGINSVLQRLRIDASASAIERLRLDVLESRVRLEQMRLDLSRGDVKPADKTRGELRQQAKTRETELAHLEARLQEALEQAASSNPSGNAPDAAPLSPALASLRGAIAAQEALLGEVQVKALALEVRAPFAGVVSSVHRAPGQAVLAGEPIATLTKPNTRYIVSYIRQDQRLRPAADDEVAVRRRGGGGKPTAARVAKVGQHLEPIPLHQLRDYNTPEWGLPVLIELPPTMDVLPGEIVDIRFVSTARS